MNIIHYFLIYKNFSDTLFQNSKSERLRSFNFKSALTILISVISLNLYSFPSTTTNIEFSNLYSGTIFIVDFADKTILNLCEEHN